MAQHDHYSHEGSMRKQRTLDEAAWLKAIQAAKKARHGYRNKKALELTAFVHDLMRREFSPSTRVRNKAA